MEDSGMQIAGASGLYHTPRGVPTKCADRQIRHRTPSPLDFALGIGPSLELVPPWRDGRLELRESSILLGRDAKKATGVFSGHPARPASPP